MNNSRFLSPRCAALLVSACVVFTANAESVRLAAEGKALMPVVPLQASVEDSACVLAHELGRITGGEFAVESERDGPAIVLGLREFDGDELRHREDYSIRTGPDGVEILGTTPLAVRNAVWDFLYRVGYRQYFPGPNWEIVPDLPTLDVSINVGESPFFLRRFVGVGMGFWGYNRESFEDWLEKNRMVSGISLRTSHSYARIIDRFREELDAMPNAYAMVDGERRYRGSSTKLNLAEPKVRELMVRYALEYFEENPDADSVSVDPSDGRGWSESPESRAAGSVSDQVALSANQVASLENPQGLLRPGMFVSVDVLYGDTEQAVLIPNNAFYRHPQTGQQGVFVMDKPGSEFNPEPLQGEGSGPLLTAPRLVKFTPLDVIADGRMASGVRGVSEGDWVVAVGKELLMDGAPEARARLISWERMMEMQRSQSRDLFEIIDRRQAQKNAELQGD